jgi:hypothetical protein
MTDGHLTDEQLSSHLDGDAATSFAGPDPVQSPSSSLPSDAATAAIVEHLTGCPSCRHRLSLLEAVRNHVRTPPPPLDPAVRAASIARVLATVGSDDAAVRAGVPERGVPITIPRRPARRPQALVGVAAAVLVLGAAVGVPLALSSESSSHSTVSASASSSALRQLHAKQHSSGLTFGSAKSAIGTVSKLGSVNSIESLRTRVSGLLPSASSTGSAGAAAAPQAAAPSTTGPTGSASATPSTVQNQDQNQLNIAAGTEETSQFERCLPAASRDATPATALQLLATATFEKTPALVYVFEPPSGSTTGATSQSVVVVIASDRCTVLASTSL